MSNKEWLRLFKGIGFVVVVLVGFLLVLLLISEKPDVAERNPLQSQSHRMEFAGEENLPDGILLLAGATYKKTWKVENTGAKPWSPSYAIVKVYGEGQQPDLGLAANASTPLGKWVNKGEKTDLSVEIRTPARAGRYRIFFELATDDGYRFGDILWLDFEIRP